MDILSVYFPVSGVQTNILLPPLIAAIISFFCSLGGITGAFLLIPFQMSFMNFTGPSVSSTNFVFNIVGIPSGLYCHVKDKRMNWPLANAIIAGALPGLFIGYFLRVWYLPEPGRFRVFVGIVLLLIAIRLALDLLKRKRLNLSLKGTDMRITVLPHSARRVKYSFMGGEYGFGKPQVFIASFATGIIGGAYGIGGGSLMAPYLISVIGLPIYSISGATLFGTFASSIAGVLVYSIVPSALNTSPDWALGALFGIGGIAGMYAGAKAQRHIPQRLVKAMVGAVMLYVALKYTGVLS